MDYVLRIVPWDQNHHEMFTTIWVVAIFVGSVFSFCIEESQIQDNPSPSLPKSSKYLLRRCLEPLKACKKEVLIYLKKAPGRLGFLEFFIGDKRLKNTAYRA